MARLSEFPPELEIRMEQAAAHQGIGTGTLVRVAVEEKRQRAIHSVNETVPMPNLPALRALEEIRKRQEGRPYTSGEDTQRMIRQARAGGMYGVEPTAE